MPNPYPAKLFYEEIFWRDRYHFFRKKGYILRPRYHPEWQASWRFEANPILELFEDSIFQWVSVFLYPLVRVPNSYNGYQKGELLDATEAREDGKNVFINSRTHPKEVKIASRLGYTENQKDKRNHCVPMLAIFSDDRDPWHQYIVMPVLRPFNKPNFTSGRGSRRFRRPDLGVEFECSGPETHDFSESRCHQTAFLSWSSIYIVRHVPPYIHSCT